MKDVTIGLSAKIQTALLSTPKRRVVTLFSSVFLLYALITLFYAGSALLKGHPFIIAGGPGDGTAGLTWLAWADQGGPVPAAMSHLTNAPFGESLRDPFQITSFFNIMGMWVLESLFSSTAAWNCMVFIGYMSSAMTMFAFIRWLLKNPWIAFFAGFAVTYTPFHVINSHGHLSYLFNALFVLLIWAFMLFWQRPTTKRALLLASATAACAYLDGYFILLGGLLIVGLFLGGVIHDLFVKKQNASHLVKHLKGTAIYVGLTVLFLSPIALVQLKYASQISGTLASSRGDIGSEAEVYSARPYEYLLPADNHPFMPDGYSEWRQSILHGSNFSESTLFIGVSVLTLAIFAWVWLLRNASRRVLLQNHSLLFVLVVLSAAALVAFLFSLQPKVHVFGQAIPLPSWFVIHLTASWRVFARLYLVVDTCLVILGSIGLYLLIQKMRYKRQVLVVLAAIIVIFIELLTQSRAVSWNYFSAPDVYGWLKQQKTVKTIAEFPLGTPPSGTMSDYLTFQQIHGKSMVNTSRPDSPQRSLHLSIAGLEDAQTISVLRRLGVDLVLSHRAPSTSSELELIRQDDSHYNDDEVWTYRIKPGKKASHALVLDYGFHAPVLKKGLESRTNMGTKGTMRIEKLTDKKAETVRASFKTKSTNEPQLITVSQQGVVRWQGMIGPEESLIDFDADTLLPIEITPYKAKSDKTISVYDMYVEE